MLKNKIIETVAHDLSRLGIKECRMDYIASSMCISKKTLYELFGSKRNLLYECICYCINRNKEQIKKEEQAAESPLIAIARINSTTLRQALEFCPAFYNEIKLRSDLSKLMDQEYVEYIHSCYLKHLVKGSLNGVFQTDINTSHTLNFFDEQIRNIHEKSTCDTILKIDNYTFTILTYMAGICTDKGRQELKQIQHDLF